LAIIRNPPTALRSCSSWFRPALLTSVGITAHYERELQLFAKSPSHSLTPGEVCSTFASVHQGEARDYQPITAILYTSSTTTVAGAIQADSM
jgi:hypothetical protein